MSSSSFRTRIASLARGAVVAAVPVAVLVAGAGTASAQPPNGGTDFIGPQPNTQTPGQALCSLCTGVLNILSGEPALVNPAPKAVPQAPLTTNSAPLTSPPTGTTGGTGYSLPSNSYGLPTSGTISGGGTTTSGGGGGLLMDDGFGSGFDD